MAARLFDQPMRYRGYEMQLNRDGTTTVTNGTTVIGCPSDKDAMAVIDGWKSLAAPVKPKASNHDPRLSPRQTR
jgi:hypothetical protein